MSGKMGHRRTSRKPDESRRQGAKTDGAFGKETADQVVGGVVSFNEDKAVHRMRRHGASADTEINQKAGETEMKEAKFEDLFREQLADLYDAEKQIVDALPKMIAASSSEDLAEALQQHLDETKEQVKRLDRVFESMGEQPAGRTCEGMQGLIREGEKMASEIQKSPVLDAAIISAAQKVEHYEISGYGTARSMAEMLGQEEIAGILQETLEEEEAADETLTDIAEAIISGDSGIEDEDIDIEEEEVEEGA